MNVAQLFNKDTSPYYYEPIPSKLPQIVFGEVKGWVPFIGAVQPLSVKESMIFSVSTRDIKTRKNYDDFFECLHRNKSLTYWGKDENFLIGKGCIFYIHENKDLEPLMVLCVDVTDPSKVKLEAPDPDYFQLYINSNFSMEHKRVYNKVMKDFVTPLLEELPIDVISTFNISKLFGKPEFPKFKTTSEMKEYALTLFNGLKSTYSGTQLGT